MHWFQTLDTELFRCLNRGLNSPAVDEVMRLASGNRFFVPALLLGGALLLWRGGLRGRLCLLMLLVIVWPGDSFVCNTVKHAVSRTRPFVALNEVRLYGKVQSAAPPVEDMSGTRAPAARDGHDSMPSSHAANWFAATMVCFIYYRRSGWFMLPLACLVSVSRVYNGVHYPSDVLAGAILGAGYAVAGLCAVNGLWQWAGQKWFPLWWKELPSLVNPGGTGRGPDVDRPVPLPKREPRVGNRILDIDAHWLRLGYVFIAALVLINLFYIASGRIELSEDEAYQWVWSKHLALSYYSKPPFIAYTQFLGTHLWGDNGFGVRFFSPVIGGSLGLLLLRFFAREVNARAGFFLLLIVATTPLLALGSVLMTVDPLSVLFWTAAMISGWRAIQPGSNTRAWLCTGLWMGMGFLSKYTELFQWLCWLVFFACWKPARAHLRRPGPYLALLINLLCALPVLIWNYQHHWITVAHVANDAGAHEVWHPTLRHFFDFIAVEAGLLNPAFFIGSIWAAVAFWRRNRHDPRLVYLFSMGAPLFLSYLLYTFHSGVLPNWIAPSVVPLFCLGAIYWDTLLRSGRWGAKAWLVAGLSIGVPMTILMHDTDLVQKLAGRPLPPKKDPMTRVRGYRSMAAVVQEARAAFLEEQKPVFVIAAHYGTTGLLTFYLPEAKTNTFDRPLVYFISTDHPVNQFYFWPGYAEQRKGENAIFVHELPDPPLVSGWILKWLNGEQSLRRHEPKSEPPPPTLVKEFESVTDLGIFEARYRGRVFHTVQLFQCRNLRGLP